MATTRIKDISSTVTSLASDDYVAVDGATNGTRKMVRGSIYTDVAAAFTGAPTTYDICPLNSGTNKIDATYLPTSGDTPKGEWNASTNSPALADGAGTAGDYYDVTTAGTQNLGSGNITFTVGDVVKYDGSVWYKIDSVANFLDGYSTAATSRTALEVNSVDEDAEATGTKLVGPALYFDGTDDHVVVSDDAKLSFTDGTDDLPFSISAWVKMEDAANFTVCAKYGTLSNVREWIFHVDNSNDLKLYLQDGAGNTFSRKSASTLTSYEGEWIHVAATYGGAGPNSDAAFSAAGDQINLFINGVAVSMDAAVQTGTYAGMADTSQPVWVGRYATSYTKGHISNVQIFNRELTATEVAQLARSGQLGFSDEWGGANGGVYTQDSTPSGEWTASAGTDADEAGPIGGRSNVLKYTCDTASGQHYFYVGGLTVGKRYRVSFDYYIPSGQSNIDGLRAGYLGNNTAFGNDTSPTQDTWNRMTGEAVAGGTNLIIYTQDGGNASYQDASGDDVVYVDGCTITEIGTLADFRSENVDEDTGKLYDISDNAFIGTLTNGPVLTGRAYPVYETGTWTPSITFGGGSTGITYSSQEGNYIRNGSVVYVAGVIVLSAVGSDTGSAKIEGLPFTSKNLGARSEGVSIGLALNMASLTSAMSAIIEDNTTKIILYDWGASGVSNLTESNFTATSQVSFSATYQIQ